MEFYNDTYCVYMHTNKIDGKKYVGQTCQKTNERWKNGKGYENSTYFYNAILKYGWDNFEALLIDKLDLMNRNKGYNLMSGGSGGRPSKEVLEKKEQDNDRKIQR